jgi:hypothetical protein
MADFNQNLDLLSQEEEKLQVPKRLYRHVSQRFVHNDGIRGLGGDEGF